MQGSSTSTTARLLQAGQAIARNDFAAAEALCRSELAADPQSAEAMSLLGVIAARCRRPADAAQMFAEAVRRAPAAGRYGVNLARALTELGRWEEAGRAVAAALDQAGGDATVLAGAADVLAKLGRHAEALEATERAAAQAPSSVELAYKLAAARHYRGDIAGAEQAYGRMLEIDPADHRAWWSLVQLRRQKPEDGRIEPMRELFKAAAGKVEPSLYLGHALAKSFEDFGEPGQALDWLLRAKAGRRAGIARTAAADTALFAAAARALPSGPGFEAEAPIFVLGLPRSGTTLVDRILSSHSKVVSAGERTDMFAQVKLMGGSRTPWLIDADALERARSIDAARLGRAYAAAARPARSEGLRFIDKAPLNVLYAGAIHRALPQARIVCLRRHPMDSCLSIFRQLFALDQPFYDYAYDLGDLARHYALFERLVAHWRETLPADRFTEVAYEAMVADQESETRRLLDFCGLGWEDACLAFHENAAPVATASAVQVRQPLYATSVGRWRNYGAGVDRLAQALRAEGVEFD
jgi:tetratricopeptide (TPR) repeat protein